MLNGWWITEWLNHPSGRGTIFVVAWVFWVIASITLHELAHGWAALAKGDPTRSSFAIYPSRPVNCVVL